MSESQGSEYAPDRVSPPGETLEEVLEERGMSQAELAERTGLTRKTINEIIKGKNALTPGTALLLEHVLNIPAHFWNNREQAYRDFLARRSSETRLAEAIPWLKELPLTSMIRRGWIKKHKNQIEQVREALRFFGVARVEQWREIYTTPQAAFRRSRAFKSDPGALAAWMRAGELQAYSIRTADYNRIRFLEVLHEARDLTSLPPEKFMPRLQELCATAGVAVVFVPEIPKAHTSGVTWWLGNKKALIQLSFRYKSNDHLWFTFFHEAAHILKHGKKLVFLEATGKGVVGKEEEEANRYAANILIPPKEYHNFAGKRSYSKQEIRSFARSVNIAPGIVVGRLQHDGYLPFSHCNDLKKRYTWES